VLVSTVVSEERSCTGIAFYEANVKRIVIPEHHSLNPHSPGAFAFLSLTVVLPLLKFLDFNICFQK